MYATLIATIRCVDITWNETFPLIEAMVFGHNKLFFFAYVLFIRSFSFFCDLERLQNNVECKRCSQLVDSSFFFSKKQTNSNSNLLTYRQLLYWKYFT